MKKVGELPIFLIKRREIRVPHQFVFDDRTLKLSEHIHRVHERVDFSVEVYG